MKGNLKKKGNTKEMERKYKENTKEIQRKYKRITKGRQRKNKGNIEENKGSMKEM